MFSDCGPDRHGTPGRGSMSANGIRPGPPGSAPCPQGSRRVPRPPGAPQLEASDSGSYTVAYQAGITRAARPFGNRPLRCIRRPVRFSRKFHHDHVDLGIARWHGDDRVERHRFQLHRGRDDQPALPGVVSRRGLMAHGHECVVRRDIKHQQRNLLQDYRPVVFPRAMPLDDTPSFLPGAACPGIQCPDFIPGPGRAAPGRRCRLHRSAR